MRKNKKFGFLTEVRPTEEQGSAPSASGKAKGKRSDPDYTQITAYVRKDTYKAVKKHLFEMEGTDFSDLVQLLLADWVKSPRI